MKDISYPLTIFLSSRSDSNPETGKQPAERAAEGGEKAQGGEIEDQLPEEKQPE